MLFLITNPVILFVAVVVLGFMIFMGTKIVREINLNNLLQQRQASMRIKTPVVTGFAKRIGLLTTTALAPIAVVAIVFTIGTTATITPTGELSDVRNANDVLNIYSDFQEKISTNQVYRFFDMVADDGLDIAAPEANDGGQGSDDYSDTNVQVLGVDEMDNVVTDGKYIYVTQYNQVFITLAYTQADEANALSNYKVINYINEETNCPTGMYITGLYVDDDYLVVIGSEYEYYCGGAEGSSEYDLGYYDYWYGYNNNVKAYVYDKHNDFSLISEYDISGNLIGTRKIDDTLFIVTSTYIPFYNEDIDVDDYLPYYSSNDDFEVAKYSDIIYVEGTSPNAFTTFYAIDLETELIDMEVILGDNGYNLYVSNDNMYLVGNIYYFVPMVEFVDVENPISETKTAIQKISINDADLEYVATGVVSGYTLNQFSMDEYNGYLRIATTTGWWGEDINNRIYVLDENLEEVGRIEKLGKPAETIRSVRFIGDYGYIVTFEQTDPFYVINLSDPEEPFKEGELEVPGFSTYLQQLNNDYMLGIGFGDNDGGINGLKISVYDISDKTNPVVFSEVIFDYSDFGWSSSSATYNHKDLLVSLNKGIIALPFSTYNWSDSEGYSYNSGILVYNFDDILGLTYDGFITHEQDAIEDVYVYKIKFISDYFYTVSYKYIKASLITDPEVITNSVTLPVID